MENLIINLSTEKPSVTFEDKTQHKLKKITTTFLKLIPTSLENALGKSEFVLLKKEINLLQDLHDRTFFFKMLDGMRKTILITDAYTDKAKWEKKYPSTSTIVAFMQKYCLDSRFSKGLKQCVRQMNKFCITQHKIFLPEPQTEKKTPVAGVKKPDEYALLPKGESQGKDEYVVFGQSLNEPFQTAPQKQEKSYNLPTCKTDSVYGAFTPSKKPK